MNRKDCVDKSGSMAELVAENSVCFKCKNIVWLPGRKCADCTQFCCDQCLENVEMKDCPRCRYGWIYKIEELEGNLVRALRFYCRREGCSQRHHGFSYHDFEDHRDEHLEQDCAKSYHSEDQPQNEDVYSGISKISQRRGLQKHDDVDMKISDAEHEEEKIPQKKDHPMHNQKGSELRNK